MIFYRVDFVFEIHSRNRIVNGKAIQMKGIKFIYQQLLFREKLHLLVLHSHSFALIYGELIKSYPFVIVYRHCFYSRRSLLLQTCKPSTENLLFYFLFVCMCACCNRCALLSDTMMYAIQFNNRFSTFHLFFSCIGITL